MRFSSAAVAVRLNRIRVHGSVTHPRQITDLSKVRVEILLDFSSTDPLHD